MTSLWGYQVRHIDADTGVITDITTYVKAIPLFTETGSGEVNEATIVLNANNGRFLIDTASTQPYITQWDKIEISGTDANTNIYTRNFEVMTIVPLEDSGSGTTVQLSLLGLEHHTQQIKYIGTHRFINAWIVGKDIGDIYNKNKGTKQPTLYSHDTLLTPPSIFGNGFPTFTVNTYPYGEAEISCYDRWMDMIDKLGSSVDAGGVLDFYELGFNTNIVDYNRIDVRIFSSGSMPEVNGGTPVVIKANGSSINLGETEGGINAQTGTQILSWGDTKKGSLPTGFSTFEAADEAFLFRPQWSPLSVPYQVNAKVQRNKVHYKCITAHTSTGSNGPPGAFWSVITEKTEFGNTVQYSPWTDDKAAVWANCGSDPYGVNYGKGFFDSNLVIWNDTFFRTWVNEIFTGVSPLKTDYVFENSGLWPRGHRILIVGSPTEFTGNDPNGVSFANSVVERVRTYGATTTGSAWVVKYKMSSALNGMQIACIDEGKVYQWNNSLSSFTDISSSDLGNDCFHPYTSLTNVEGVDPRPAAQGWATNINSAIEVTYTFPSFSLRSVSGQNYYKIGAWLGLAFPFPINKHGISEVVGGLYGPSTNTEALDEPSTFDLQNMTWTHDGKRGFNFSSSEDYGPISGIAFYMKISSTVDQFGALSADIPIRCTAIDTNDNIAVSDFTIPFRDNWTSVEIASGSFKTYAAQAPRYAGVLELIPPKELPTDRIFEWHNLKYITFQIQSQYDKDGRYFPENRALENADVATLVQTIIGGTIKMTIDGFRFVKPLLASSGTVSDRVIQPDFLQKTYIGNKSQLTNDSKSQLEIDKFQHEQFDITTSGRFDIRFGDSFYYENPRLVNRFDDPANPSLRRVKLVAKRIEHSITKSSGGKGGFITRLVGVRRFT